MGYSKIRATHWMTRRWFWDFRARSSFASKLKGWACSMPAKNTKSSMTLSCTIGHRLHNWTTHSTIHDRTPFQTIKVMWQKMKNSDWKQSSMNWPVWIPRGAKSEHFFRSLLSFSFRFCYFSVSFLSEWSLIVFLIYFLLSLFKVPLDGLLEFPWKSWILHWAATWPTDSARCIQLNMYSTVAFKRILKYFDKWLELRDWSIKIDSFSSNLKHTYIFE